MAVKGLLGHKNVALGAPGIGLVALLQDQNCILHVAVCKVNPEVGPTRSPTHSPRYRSPDPQQVFWEVHPESLGLPGEWGGEVLPPGHPNPCRSGSRGVPPANPLISQLLTPVILPSSTVAPEMLFPSPLSFTCRPPPTPCLTHGMPDIPCQPSSPCLSVGQPGQRFQWGRQTPSVAFPVGLAPRGRCWLIRIPLIGMGEIKKLHPISIKCTKIYYLCLLLDAQ